MKVRLIINSLKITNPDLHDAISYVRQHHFFALELRVAYFPEDIDMMVKKAQEDGVDRLIAGGGDGTVNQVLNSIMKLEGKKPALGILPLGTANDFANSANIPMALWEALLLAINGNTFKIDIGKCNERYFLNIASGGFGAQITTETAPELKELLGGGAYALTGLFKLFSFNSVQGKMKIGDFVFEGSSFSTAVCNGRQAGGGILLSLNACIDDGYLNIVLFTTEPLIVPPELSPASSTIFGGFPFKKELIAKSVEFTPSDGAKQINLDGEPYQADSFKFEIYPSAIDLILPDNSPLFCGDR